jgi:excisionase family DNA binding protein
MTELGSHPPEDLISTSEAAVVLGVSPLTVRRMIDRGTLTARRVANVRVLSRAQVDSLARLQDSPERVLSPRAISVLDSLARAGSGTTAKGVAKGSGHDTATVRYYLGLLRHHGFAVRLGRAPAPASGPPSWLWSPTQAGLDALATAKADRRRTVS